MAEPGPDPQSIGPAEDAGYEDGTAAPSEEAAEPILKPPSRGARLVLNTIIAVAVPATIVWFVVTNWDELAAGPWNLQPVYLVLAGILLLVAEGIAPIAWMSLMRSAGTPAPRRQVWFVWFAVEPLKYLPIPVGPVLGRYALADRVGLEPFAAVVTLAYDFVLATGVGFAIVFPGLVWLAFAVEPGYRWAVLVVVVFMLAMLWATMRQGGLARLIREALGHEHDATTGVDITRRALTYPAVITLVMLGVRILANGTILAAITPVEVAWIPLYGLVFAIGSLVPFSRFGTREGAIVIGLGALGIDAGPALLAALTARAMGLLACLLWLGVSVVIGGAKRLQSIDTEMADSEPG